MRDFETRDWSRRRFFGAAGSAAAALGGLALAAPSRAAQSGGFIGLLQPAPREGGFRMEGFWIWGGSVIRGEDGRYHMFAARWPAGLSFSPHDLTNSEIVRAVSDTPAGPYSFEEVVLPSRGESHWDGRATLEPAIHRQGDTFLLFYTGTTYEGETPAPGRPAEARQHEQARDHRRIGVATAKSVRGPWTRSQDPILFPRPGRWDGVFTANPAPCLSENGEVLLIYGSEDTRDRLLKLGVAKASHPEGPYPRQLGDPIFDNKVAQVADPCVWRTNGEFRMILSDLRGAYGGERGGGALARSTDGVHWEMAEAAKAYSRGITFAGGERVTHARAGRPQLLIEDGQPTHLFLAVTGPATAGGNYRFARNLAIPLSAAHTET